MSKEKISYSEMLSEGVKVDENKNATYSELVTNRQLSIYSNYLSTEIGKSIRYTQYITDEESHIKRVKKIINRNEKG